ncbi:MAG: DUF732 domain-containing protein [Mycobacterium sp.]
MGGIAAIILLIGVVALAWRPWDSQQTSSAGTTSTMAATTPLTSTNAHLPPPPETLDKYVTTLDNQRIPYRSRNDIINVGMQMCQELRDGQTPEDAIRTTADAHGYQDHAGLIIDAAAMILCPDQQPSVDAFSDG